MARIFDLILHMIVQCLYFGALLYGLSMLIKVCFEENGARNSAEAAFAYITGTVSVLGAIATTVIILVVIIGTICLIVHPELDKDTQQTTVPKATGAKNKVTPIRASQSTSPERPSSESPSTSGQLGHSRDSKATTENFELLSVVCSNPKGKKSEKSSRLQVAVISPSEVIGAKWRNGEEDGVGQKEMNEARSPLEGVTVVCSREPRKARLPRREENVETPPPSYNDVIRGEGQFKVSKQVNAKTTQFVQKKTMDI